MLTDECIYKGEIKGQKENTNESTLKKFNFCKNEKKLNILNYLPTEIVVQIFNDFLKTKGSRKNIITLTKVSKSFRRIALKILNSQYKLGILELFQPVSDSNSNRYEKFCKKKLRFIETIFSSYERLTFRFAGYNYEKNMFEFIPFSKDRCFVVKNDTSDVVFGRDEESEVPKEEKNEFLIKQSSLISPTSPPLSLKVGNLNDFDFSFKATLKKAVGKVRPGVRVEEYAKEQNYYSLPIQLTQSNIFNENGRNILDFNGIKLVVNTEYDKKGQVNVEVENVYTSVEIFELNVNKVKSEYHTIEPFRIEIGGFS
ncbi:hypothetical protein HK099_007456 [Clydaea vesicula]|uniref:F-box domain-containing protein n=1 Tax=Clydaea vesicula TaxID=447962 RepID=A0AAD5TWX1_9FUNG|nr:hypothetical protein HK099_007456 [Clydaea vesicula]